MKALIYRVCVLHFTERISYTWCAAHHIYTTHWNLLYVGEGLLIVDQNDYPTVRQ